MMKRVWLLVLFMAVLLGTAGAEEAAVEAEVFLRAWPDYTLMAVDQCGDTAAAVLAREEQRVLCVAEKYNGEWRLTLSNPAALRPGKSYSVLLDTDSALFWSYAEDQVWYSYASGRENGVWGPVSCMRAVADSNGLTETEHVWHEGVLQRRVWRRDLNDNLEYHQAYTPIPMAWLEDYALLASYDCAVFPEPGEYKGSWLSQDGLARCAQEARPGWTFLGGSAEDELELLLRSPGGETVLLGITCAGGKPATAVSSPLPEGTRYGCENFTTVLRLPDGLMASVAPNADGTWRLNYTWPDTAEGEPVFVGENWVAADTLPGTVRYIGDHPWTDMASMDWTSLPHTLEEAVRRLDTGRWAVVNNPNPADRLHLRADADKDAASLGKYYNGTPVEVLEKGGTWSRVRLPGGVGGWMMTRYLAFDTDMHAVANAFPDLQYVHGRELPVYASLAPDSESWTAESRERACVIGLAEEQWYHIWFPESGRSGYMKQSDFTPGNG